MKAHRLTPVLLLFCMGCARTMISTNNPNYEEVWFGSLDVVSDELHVEKADKDRGVIVGSTDTRWVRSRAVVEIVKYRGFYYVKAKAQDEKLRVFLMTSGLRTGEDEQVLRDNPSLANHLLEQIEWRVKKYPIAAPAPTPPKPAAKPSGDAKPSAPKEPAKTPAKPGTEVKKTPGKADATPKTK